MTHAAIPAARRPGLVFLLALLGAGLALAVALAVTGHAAVILWAAERSGLQFLGIF